jgi:hypothetical protein
VVRPVVTRVERYAGHCLCCCGVTLAPVPEGMEEGSPFSVNILALAIFYSATVRMAGRIASSGNVPEMPCVTSAESSPFLLALMPVTRHL